MDDLETVNAYAKFVGFGLAIHTLLELGQDQGVLNVARLVAELARSESALMEARTEAALATIDKYASSRRTTDYPNPDVEDSNRG